MSNQIKYRSGLFLFLFALLASPASAQSGEDNWQGRELPPHIDLQIIPVGNVPLARFSRDAETNFGPSDEAEAEAGDDVGAAPLKSGLSAITTPENEQAPRRYYVKQGGSYYMLSCNQNSISTPVRIPVSSPQIEFYSMAQNADGERSLRKAFTHILKPGQESLLFTLTKPLKERSWENPNVTTYDLSARKLKDQSVVVINACEEAYIAGVANQNRFALKPHGISAIGLKNAESLRLQIAGSPDKENWSETQKLSLPVMSNSVHLLLAYEVPEIRSPRGFKITRGKLAPDRFREASKGDPR